MLDNERRSWLIGSPRGSFKGIDLSLLDPSDPDDRNTLVRAEHPDMGEEVTEDFNPQLHIAYHEVVANQIWDDDPPETWQTAQRLRALGHERHEILHMLASVVASTTFDVARE